MEKASKILIISLVLVLSGSLSVWAGEVTGLIEFKAKDPALASEVNDNFNAVKAAVDDNYTAIQSNYEEITKNASDINDLGVQAGIAYPTGFSLFAPTIGTTAASLRYLEMNAPADGWAIVTACGTVKWEVTSSTTGSLALNLSTTAADTSTFKVYSGYSPGMGTGTILSPFSITAYFNVSKGTNTFYLNGQKLASNATSTLNGAYLSAIFVPQNYSVPIKLVPLGQ
jgi:hypothetical protein